MPPRGNVHVRITGDSSDLDRAARKGERSFGLLKKATATAAVGVAGGIAAMVNTAADFEAQMSSLESVTNGNTRTMKQFRAQALKAGADTAFSASEAASAQIELAKGGLSVANIMKGGLKSSLALAAAGGLELADAAAYTANAMKLFGLEGAKSMQVADGLAAAANATTADVSDFGLALTQGGGAAKSAGMSFQQTMLALEALAQSGVKGSDAGTSLKSALVQLAAPTEKQLGLTEELGLKFFNAEGKMKPLAHVSDMLRDRLGKMGDQQRLATLKTLAGTDGFRALLAVYDQGPKKLNALERGLAKQGSAAAVAAKRQDNLKGSMEALGGSIETIAILAGSVLVPPLTDAATATAEFIGEMATGKGAGGEFVQTLSEIGGVALDVGEAVGPVAGDFIQLAGGFAQSEAAVVLLSAGVGGLTGRMVGLGAAFAVGKVASYVGTIKTLAGAMGTLRTVYVAQTGVTNASTTAVLRHAAASRIATGASRGLSVAMMSTGIGAIAVLAGTAIGALMGFADASDDSADAQRDLAGAIEGTHNALDRIANADLDAKQAKIDHRAAVANLEDAEARLDEVRKNPKATAAERERAEIAVAQARVDLQRKTREARNSERDYQDTVRSGMSEAHRNVQTLREERDARRSRREETRKGVDKLEDEIATMQRTGATTKQLKPKLEELRSKQRQLRDQTAAVKDAQRDLASAMRSVRNTADKATPKIKDFGDKLKGLKPFTKVELELIATGAPRLRDLSDFADGGRRRPSRNRNGGFVTFSEGGMVPSLLSPGEVGVLPGGGSFTVPGPRVAADTVPMLLPQNTAVLTDHGQQLVSAGASITEAISWQMPHFQNGGVVKAAESLRGVGIKGRQLVVMTAIPGRESGYDPKAVGGPNRNGTFDHGAWQANDIWANDPVAGRYWSERYTWAGGAKIAKRIAKKQGPSAWMLNGWNADSTIAEHMLAAERAVGRIGSKGGKTTRVTAPAITHPLLGDMLDPLTDDALMGGIEAGRTGAPRRPLLSEVLQGIVPESDDRPQRESVSFSGRPGDRGIAASGSVAKRIAKMKRTADAIAAKGMPYQYGGYGNPSYDCSGYASAVANAGGLLEGRTDTLGFKNFGLPGKGRNVTFGIRGGAGMSGHMMFQIAGQHYESGGGGGPRKVSGWNGSFDTWRHPKFRKGGVVGGQKMLPPSPEGMRHLQGIAARRRVPVATLLDPKSKGFVGWGMRNGGIAGKRLKVGEEVGGKDGRRKFDDGSGILVRGGKVVRAFAEVPKSWANLPVSPIPGGAGLRGLVGLLGGSPGTDGADTLTRRIASRLPNESFGQLRRSERFAKREIRGMAKHGFTGPERIKTRRMRGALSLLQDEQGRRIGTPLGASDRDQEYIARNESNLSNFLTVAGIDPESLKGLNAQREVAGHSLKALKARQRGNKQALKKAKRTGNKKAIAAAETEIAEVEDQMLGLRASMKDLAAQIAERTGPRAQANRDLALAGLTADTEDDRQALTKLRDIAAQQLEEAKQSGDPQAIADAAGELKAAVDALAAATPTGEDYANAALAMAGLTETTEDDRAALLELQRLAQGALDAALQTADPRDDIEAANNLKQVNDSLKSLDETIAQANEIQKQREDFEKERLEVDKELVRLTKTQGPTILAALMATAEGWIGGNAATASSVPATAGVPANYR